MIHLRPYQTEAIALLQDGFRQGHKRQIYCAPTGSGKSLTFSEMVAKAALKGTETLILTDRIELFKQNFRAIESRGITPAILNSSTKSRPNSPVVLAMVETLKRRLRTFTFNPGLIIIDEAHKKSFNKLIEHFPNAYIIGATATPVGPHFHQYYTNIVNNISIQSLVDQGFLCRCRPFQMVDDLSDVSIVAGEYEESSLFAHFNKRKMYEGVVEEYMKNIPGKKTLVFNVNIEHSNEMTNQFNQAGIRSFSLTSNTPEDERHQILRDYTNGLFPVLNNCGILTTGYDEPSIEAVIMNRATLSLPLFLQCLGRASRPFENKDFFTVLDFGLNHDRHGLWQEDRDWSIKPPKKKGPLKPAAIKKCPQCTAILPAAVSKCQYCGYEYPQASKEELASGYLVEIKPDPLLALKGKKINDLTIEDLILCEKHGRFTPRFVWRILRTRGKQALAEYAKIKGYKSFWATSQMKYDKGVNAAATV